jgi:hypothetical protein
VSCVLGAGVVNMAGLCCVRYLWVRQMWYEPGACVVCIYCGVNKWCLPVDGCLAALVGCVSSVVQSR